MVELSKEEFMALPVTLRKSFYQLLGLLHPDRLVANGSKLFEVVGQVKKVMYDWVLLENEIACVVNEEVVRLANVEEVSKYAVKNTLQELGIYSRN